MNKELTLLTKEQVENLEVLQKYGPRAAITDLVILTGGPGWYYFTQSSNGGDVVVISEEGTICYGGQRSRIGTIRPVLQSSAIFDLISQNRVKGYYGTEEVEYGEYPQYAPGFDVQELLEQELRRGYLQKTGKSYTFNSTRDGDYKHNFQPVTYDEYEYNGKKFIRIEAKSYRGEDGYCDLSNGKKYKDGDNVWVEVSPVRWLIDDRTKTLVSKRGILSGIEFITDRKYDDNYFSSTVMKWYLDKYMSKELTQSSTLIKDMTPEEKEKNVDFDKINNILDLMDMLCKEEKVSKELVKSK